MCLDFFKKDIGHTTDIIIPTEPVSVATPNKWSNIKPIELSRIKKYDYPENKYFHEEHKKDKITLHHTMSGQGIGGDVNTWIQSKHNVGTALIIERDGTPWQLFPSKYWAYHLGTGNHDLDRQSIGVEIDNWGGLVLGDGTVKKFGDKGGKSVLTVSGKYYAYYGNIVNVPIQEYPNGFRGYNYFEKYTDEQIITVGELLLFWKIRYNIPLYYNPTMFNLSQEARNGKPGVWSHTSYRTDKSDIHPQPELLEMLQTICTDEMPVSYSSKQKWFVFRKKSGLYV